MVSLGNDVIDHLPMHATFSSGLLHTTLHCAAFIFENYPARRHSLHSGGVVTNGLTFCPSLLRFHPQYNIPASVATPGNEELAASGLFFPSRLYLYLPPT